jgi:hypothetical protein
MKLKLFIQVFKSQFSNFVSFILYGDYFISLQLYNHIV